MSPTTEQASFNPNYRRYNTSFTYFIVSLILFLVGAFAIYAKTESMVSDTIADILVVIALVLNFGFSLAGFILGTRSYLKKEDSHYKKWLGLLGNFAFVSLFIIALIFNVFDFLTFLNS